MGKRSKVWIIGYFILVLGALLVIARWVVRVDPFFHYHAPLLDSYYYELNNERSQNDGISKHFDYNALITGTSMTENFKTSEMDQIFGTKSIKVSYSGGSYKEINDNVKVALSHNPDLKTVVRGLDMAKFTEQVDLMREDLGEYPFYLYDQNIFNDVNYVFNRDVVFKYVAPMILANDDEGFQPGITSFDSYANWMSGDTFGVNAVCPNGVPVVQAGEAVHLSDAERDNVLETVRQNVTSIAESYPDVTFYYFFTPYSIMWWQPLISNGTVYKQIEAERIVIEEILQYDNIKLYSFNGLTDMITDLNNYKDTMHYGSLINSLILRYMKDGKCLLTQDNYEQYLEEELHFYVTYDFTQLNKQVDYEKDYYAEALLNQTVNGVEPLAVSEEVLENAELQNAAIVTNQYAGTAGITCRGTLQREHDSEMSIFRYIATTGYVGAKIRIDDIGPYKYLTFNGRKEKDQGHPRVYVYGEGDHLLAECGTEYQDLDNEWHQYLLDVSQLEGSVTVAFQGGYTDNTGSEDSCFTFSNIVFY